MSLPIDESLLDRLPLPLGQLYRRAHNAKTSLEHHQAAYYLWEATLKLLASAAIVEYMALGVRDPPADERLRSLARPALGHWWDLVRRLLPILAGACGDDPRSPVRRAHDTILGRTRDDLPRSVGLDALLAEVLDGKGGSRTTVRVCDLFERVLR